MKSLSCNGFREITYAFVIQPVHWEENIFSITRMYVACRHLPDVHDRRAVA
jgi:hypothetical protein